VCVRDGMTADAYRDLGEWNHVSIGCGGGRAPSTGDWFLSTVPGNGNGTIAGQKGYRPPGMPRKRFPGISDAFLPAGPISSAMYACCD